MSYSPCFCLSSLLSPDCMILVYLEINCKLVLHLEVWESSLQLIRITVKEFTGKRHFKSSQQGNEHDP